MGEVRVFTEEHVRDVADLHLRAMRGQSRPAPQSLQDYFREIFFGNPWVTPEISPLVYIEKGKLVGFLGVIPRPMEFRGRPIRVAVAAQFMVERKEYRGLAAVELLRHLFRGPQELSFTDGSGEGASLVWTAAGARVARLYSFNWLRVLRPFGAARGMLDRIGGASPMLKRASGLVAAPMDFLLSKAPLEVLRRPKSQYTSKPVHAVELLQCIQESRGREPLQPAYELLAFNWLMSQAAKATGNGVLRMMTVHSPDGLRCGSFVYYVKPRGPAYVLQIGCRRRDQFPEILRTLFQDAWEQGAYAVKGQAIPQFLARLSEQYCMFRQLDSCVVGYSGDPDIMNSFLLGETALSRLDGECWLRFQMEDWSE